ncbi:thyrotropin-releasing hormone receptor-like isoform X2 [Mytilus edulis]|uniref:thyrotropin-releasing hormone receptor-like isoform X2 n=1 Tax=Mytilus edulis TaxID=6550 RepID=UPI0039F0D34D
MNEKTNESIVLSVLKNESTTNSMYYPKIYQIISVLFGIIIFLVGFFGNILVVIIVSKSRKMRSPTNCYLISLAVADILVLFSATLPAIPEPFFEMQQWPWGRAMCSILVFLQYLGVDASSLSITAFTIERYIAICHPMTAQRMCTIRRAKKIICGIWIFSILYCSPWLGLTIIIKAGDKSICTFRLEREQYNVYYLADLIVFYAIPLCIAAILYALIARILFGTTIASVRGGQHRDASHARSATSSRKQVVRMLIVIVSVFATMWLPYRVMVVYNSFAKTKYLDIWFLLFCRVMVYINSSINPILYNAMSAKFRREFQKILSCGTLRCWQIQQATSHV